MRCCAVIPNTDCNWEPIELQILKKQLANLKCSCTSCESSKDPALLGQDSDHNDAAIQVEIRDNPISRHNCGLSNTSTAYTEEQNRNNMMEYFRDDLFCPNCYFIWNLLKRFTKVFKDEECEARPDMFSSDKSTESEVELIDSATSVTLKPAVVSLPSNLTLCDFISESTLNTDTPHAKSKTHNDRVTFTDDFEHNICYLKKDTKAAPMHGHCFCLENYIEAIRPPLPI